MINKLAKELVKNIKFRFSGLIKNIYEPLSTTNSNENYADPCFLIASFLDPNFKFFWIDAIEDLDENYKTLLKAKIRNLVMTECINVLPKSETNQQNNENNQSSIPSGQVLRIYSSQTSSIKESRNRSNSSVGGSRVARGNRSLSRSVRDVSNIASTAEHDLIQATQKTKKAIFKYSAQKEKTHKNNDLQNLSDEIGKLNILFFEYSLMNILIKTDAQINRYLNTSSITVDDDETNVAEFWKSNLIICIIYH